MLVYKLIVYLFAILKKKTLLYIRNKLFYYFKKIFIYIVILFYVSFITMQKYLFIKFQYFYINIFPRYITYEQNKKNLTKN